MSKLINSRKIITLPHAFAVMIELVLKIVFKKVLSNDGNNNNN